MDPGSLKLKTLLITVSGKDGPGIFSEVTGALSQGNTQIHEFSQSVTHGLLSLSIVCTVPGEPSELVADLKPKLERLGITMDWRFLSGAHATRNWDHPDRRSYALTLLSPEISAKGLHDIAAILAREDMNIDRIRRLSDQDFSCIEFIVSTQSPKFNRRDVQRRLIEAARPLGIDVALQAEGLVRRAKRLVVFDMDSTFIQNEVIDELAREKGVYDAVSEITREAMNGKLDFTQSLIKRVALLKGLDEAALGRVSKRIALTSGAQDLITILKQLGFKTALISGGFKFVADRIQSELKIDYAYANVLERDSNGVVTGRVTPPVVDAQKKADLLEQIAQAEKIAPEQVVAVGDGANDLLMLERAGLGIAFNAKPAVSEQAGCAIHQKDLRTILYLLGLSAKDVAEALALRPR